jgi:SAM-dependent methyltransferase
LFHVEQCPSCQLLYTNPRPNTLKIRDYYKSEAYLSHTEKGRSVLDRVYRAVRQRMLEKKIRLLRRYVSQGSEVMDIGCGTGAFLEALQKVGYRARGIEPQDGAREIARKKNLEVAGDMESLNALPDKCLDGITMWHVLEHMHDLTSSLESIQRVLLPGGVLVIAVPIHSSYDAEFYKEHWAAYDLPRHLYHFDRETIQAAAGAHGFRLVSRQGLPFDSFYVSLLSEKQSGKLPAGLRQVRALGIGLLSNLFAMAGRRPWSSEVFVFQKERRP